MTFDNPISCEGHPAPCTPRLAMRPIPAGQYVVKVIVPPGYQLQKEEDKNVDFGDSYVPQQYWLAGYPLADGGVSAMYGRDTHGPTALLKSVSKLPFEMASNGALLNMKFLPRFFKTDAGIGKFVNFLRTFCKLGISHIQFNVLNEADLRAAQKEPEKYRGMTVRVAGYTAYFTELAADLQEEIIARTSYETV
jgi:hypothetical protein